MKIICKHCSKNLFLNLPESSLLEKPATFTCPYCSKINLIASQDLLIRSFYFLCTKCQSQLRILKDSVDEPIRKTVKCPKCETLYSVQF